MRINIEDYFGNDVLRLHFPNKHRLDIEDKTVLTKIESIVMPHGYNVADADVFSNAEHYVRVQQIEIEESEEQAQSILVNLIVDICKHFLT